MSPHCPWLAVLLIAYLVDSAQIKINEDGATTHRPIPNLDHSTLVDKQTRLEVIKEVHAVQTYGQCSLYLAHMLYSHCNKKAWLLGVRKPSHYMLLRQQGTRSAWPCPPSFSLASLVWVCPCAFSSWASLARQPPLRLDCQYRAFRSRLSFALFGPDSLYCVRWGVQRARYTERALKVLEFSTHTKHAMP